MDDDFSDYNTQVEVENRVQVLTHTGRADAFVLLNAHLRKEQIRSDEGMYITHYDVIVYTCIHNTDVLYQSSE
jgi:hypothetical protein